MCQVMLKVDSYHKVKTIIPILTIMEIAELEKEAISLLILI